MILVIILANRLGEKFWRIKLGLVGHRMSRELLQLFAAEKDLRYIEILAYQK